MDFSLSPLTKSSSANSAAVTFPQRREAPAVEVGAPAPQKAAVDEKALKERVEEVNHALAALDDHLQFSVHKETNAIVIKLVDNVTQEVLREFPSEKFLDLVARLQKLPGSQVDVTR